MANTESPNTLLSNATVRILDLVCEGPISGFMRKPGAYGTDPLCSTYYDDVVVRNTDGSYNYNISGQGYSFAYTRGTADQTGIGGFQKVESTIPLSNNTRIANPPNGAGPFKPVIASFTSSTYPDADAIKVTVRVPALAAQDDQGNTNPFEIVYAVDISINNGAFVQVGSHTIVGKCTSTYQRTTSYSLPKSTPPSAYYEWKVRVRRVSQNILSMRVQNEIFVDSISIISSSLYAYPNTVLVGTEIGADQFGTVPTRAYEIAGMLVSVPAGYSPTSYGYNETPFTRQCDYDAGNKLIGFTTQDAAQADGVLAGMRVAGAGIPSNAIVTSVSPGPVYFFSIDQDPTLTKVNETLTFTPTATDQVITPATYPNVWLGNFTTGVWTDNPAWIFYDILTNPVHGLGDIIESSFVDKWALYEISQYCDTMVDDGAGGLEPRFTCNVVIQQQENAYTVLLNLASTFRGMLYYSNGGIHASQQQDKSPVYAFNNSNVVEGAFSYSDTAKDTRATVAKVKWVDPKNGYRENVEYIEDVEGILRYGYQEKEMTAFACTSKGQAYRLGSWTLQSERLLTETVTFQTSLEGLALKPGDNFSVYDNFRNNRVQAGRVASFSSGRNSITLDRNVALEPNVYYTLTVDMPKFQLDGTGDLTGSNQISLIRQSQVETYGVTTGPTSGIGVLNIDGQFSTGLFAGSPFILSASGVTGSAFLRSSLYTCLATAEVEPGKTEVLGLQWNTGIQFAIQTGFTTVDWPSNSGDIGTPILPPSNLLVAGITGVTADDTFYSSINLTWQPSPSPDLAYYVVSGKEWNTAYSRFEVTDTGFNFTRGATGQYAFKVAAVSNGGRDSTFITGGYLVSSSNPLGTLRPLSGVRLVGDYDPLYVHATSGYTGYVGLTPTFEWTFANSVDQQFVSGYRLNFTSYDGATLYRGPIDLSGANVLSYQLTGGQIYSFTGGPQRGWDFRVQTIDIYGNVAYGANLKVNNPPMKPPLSSGFAGLGGFSYSVTPDAQYDTSGLYIWTKQSPAFTPTYDNSSYVSENLAGTANIGFPTGQLWTWFALVDTFGRSGNAIYGPVSGDANSVATADNALSGWARDALTQTGVILDAKIDSASGWARDALTQTGVTLGAKIDSASGWARDALTATGVDLGARLVATGGLLSAVKVTGSSILNNVNLVGIGGALVIHSGDSVLISGVAPFGTTASGLQGDGTDASAAGFRGIPQVIVSGNTTISGSYNGKHLYKQPADATSPVWTFTGNAALPLPIGYVVTLVNDSATGSIRIMSTTGEVVTLAGVGTVTGTFTLGVTGVATALKVGTQRWQFNGVGLSIS